ncbi:MAG: A/G-specific adenine glycosylase [Victivallales bacterium]|nr:A/G-specific adenine glycosylase [Victivallales bacterium]
MTPEIINAILDWFGIHARALPWRKDATPYHVWLSEILLQQTRIAAVLVAYRRFLEHYPTVEDLANGDVATLMKLWEGLGYYSRARNLKKCAQVVTERGGFPRTAEELQMLPGIGPYTAGAIAAIAFNQPAVAVDGNVARVVSRLLGRTLSREATAEFLRPWLPAGKAGAFVQAWMELGELLCLPRGKPHCEECPLRAHCNALKANRTDELPAKPPRPARPVIKLTVFHLTSKDGRIALRKRPPTGLLAGLWEFPNCPGSLSAVQAKKWLEEQGFSVRNLATEPPTRHLFTHREWQMANFQATVSPESSLFLWATPDELENQYALPTAFRNPQGRRKAHGNKKLNP